MSNYPYLFGALNTREGDGDYQSRICPGPLAAMEDTLRRLANDSLECLRENDNYLKRTLAEGVWVKGALPGKLINGKRAYIIGVAASGNWFFKTHYKDAYDRDLFYFIAYVYDTTPPEAAMSLQYFTPILNAVEAMNNGAFSGSEDMTPPDEMAIGTKGSFGYSEKCREMEIDGDGIYPMEYDEAAWFKPCGDGLVFINVMEPEDARKIWKTYAPAIVCCRNIKTKEIFRRQWTTIAGKIDDKYKKWSKENYIAKPRRNKKSFISDNLDTLTEQELASIYMQLQNRNHVEKEIKILLQDADTEVVERIYKKMKLH